jgi:hypothetical protein
MSKKNFYKLDWNEVAALLLADFFITLFFGFWFVSGCFYQQNMIIINPYLVCTLLFLIVPRNVICLFVNAVVFNYIVFWIWHRAVKK